MQRTRTTELLRNARLLATLAFCFYAVLLATQSRSGFPADGTAHGAWPWLADKPLNEDGFYMLTVADNFATGHGLAYNFGPPVTGIQPLSTLIFAAVAYVVHHLGGDRWMLIRFILLFGAGTHLVFARVIARFSASLLSADVSEDRRTLVSTIAFFLMLCDLTVFRLQTCGLETGIYLCLVAVCITTWRRLVMQPNLRAFILFGISGGLAGLARIDFGLIFALLLLFLIARRIGSFMYSLLSGAIALALVSPWFLYVRHITGGWMPTSGSVESGLAHRGYDRVIAWSLAMLAHLAPWSYAAINHVETTAIAVLSLVALIVLAITTLRTSTSVLEATLRQVDVRETLLPWAAALVGLSVVYAITFQSTFFYVRYFVPLLLVSVPLLALLLSDQSWLWKRPTLSFLLLSGLFAGQLFATLHRGSYGNPRFLSGAYLIRNFPGVHIGAWQSGVIGYIDRDVENLDGKLNAQAYQATKTNTLGDFIDREGINVISDWPGYLVGTLPAGYLAREWQPCSQPRTTTDDVCYIRKTFAANHPEFR